MNEADNLMVGNRLQQSKEHLETLRALLAINRDNINLLCDNVGLKESLSIRQRITYVHTEYRYSYPDVIRGLLFHKRADEKYDYQYTFEHFNSIYLYAVAINGIDTVAEFVGKFIKEHNVTRPTAGIPMLGMSPHDFNKFVNRLLCMNPSPVLDVMKNSLRQFLDSILYRILEVRNIKTLIEMGLTLPEAVQASYDMSKLTFDYYDNDNQFCAVTGGIIKQAMNNKPTEDKTDDDSI